MSFELVDLETGNFVGMYSTEEAALLDVAEMIRSSGPEAVATLALGSDEPAPDGRVIAEGPALAERAAHAVSPSEVPPVHDSLVARGCGQELVPQAGAILT